MARVIGVGAVPCVRGLRRAGCHVVAGVHIHGARLSGLVRRRRLGGVSLAGGAIMMRSMGGMLVVVVLVVGHSLQLPFFAAVEAERTTVPVWALVEDACTRQL